MKKGFLKFRKKLNFFTSKKQVSIFKEEEKERLKLLAKELGDILRPKPNSYDIDEQIAKMTGDGEVYLYDFLQEANGNFMGYGVTPENPIIAIAPTISNNALVAVDGGLEKKPARVYKPIEVFAELERVPAKIDLENLDDKITIMRMKKDFIKNNPYAKKEVIDMVVRFENRKKYAQYKDFFEKFETTTTGKINALVSKYKLVLRSSDLFVPTFPKEAVLIMKDFIKNTKELCNKKPVFYVIAEAKDFAEESRRNDPILLAQSPFGIYWYILGAWDKELLLLEEL